MRRARLKTGPPKEEWDYRRIPQEETLACCLYEYAREFSLGSPELQQKLTKRALAESAPKGSQERLGSFAAFCAVYDLLDTPLGSPYSRADMAIVPWMQLSAEERTHAKYLSEKRKQIPVTEAQAKAAFAGLVEAPRYVPPSKRGGQGVQVVIVADAADHPAAIPDFSDFFISKVALQRVRDLEEDALQFGFIAIDWNYTNEQLSNALLDWFDRELSKRPSRKPAYSKRGKEKENSPDGWLKALGATRLLRSGMTLQQARDYSAAAASGLPIFSDISEWSRARRKTFPSIMKQLFGPNVVCFEEP